MTKISSPALREANIIKKGARHAGCLSLVLVSMQLQVASSFVSGLGLGGLGEKTGGDINALIGDPRPQLARRFRVLIALADV